MLIFIFSTYSEGDYKGWWKVQEIPVFYSTMEFLRVNIELTTFTFGISFVQCSMAEKKMTNKGREVLHLV